MLLVAVVVVVAVVEVVAALPAPAVLVRIAEPKPHSALQLLSVGNGLGWKLD